MKATQKLHEMGQSLWLDNITRDLLTSGTLHRYIQEFSVTGLTSNPTIFDHAIENSHDTDDAIRRKLPGKASQGEALFFNWRSKTSGRPPICFGPFTTKPMAWTAGCRWRFSLHLGASMTRPTPSPRPRNSTPARAGPTSSSRYHLGNYDPHIVPDAYSTKGLWK